MCPATKDGDSILTLPKVYLVKNVARSPVTLPMFLNFVPTEMGVMWKLQLASRQSGNFAAKRWFILEEPADSCLGITMRWWRTLTKTTI